MKYGHRKNPDQNHFARQWEKFIIEQNKEPLMNAITIRTHGIGS